MRSKQQHLDEAFAAVEEAAILEHRCPQNRPLGPLRDDDLPMLASAGRIRVEIWGRNWRVVTILDGPHRGKHTQLPPGGGKPWKVDGARVQAQWQKPQRQKPWSPALERKPEQ